jgi:hypothetical protein
MGRPVVRSLVVRIYRSSPDNPDCLLGEVEEVGKKGLRSFKNLEELWAIVNRPVRKKIPGRTGERPPVATEKEEHHET